jgi:hypothetical protein
MKAPSFNAKLLAIWLAVCVAAGGLLSWLSGMSLWASLPIVAIALFLNGLVAEVEDNAPGGIHNPRE